MFTYEVVSNKNCNFKCYFCFANANVEQECNVLSLENFIKGLDISLHKVLDTGEDMLFVKVYGGESLIYTDRIVEFIKAVIVKAKLFEKLNFSFSVITNGSIIKDELLDIINESKNYPNLRVTLTFSMESNKTLHDTIRQFKGGQGSFDLVSSNIRRYYEVTGRHPHIQTVLSPDLLADVDGYIDFLSAFRDIAVYELVPMFDDTFESVDPKLIYNMYKIFDHYIDRYLNDDYEHIGLFQPLRSITNRFFKFEKKKHCNAGWKQMTIVPNGDIYPCSRFMHNNVTKTRYGHCSDKDLLDTFNSAILDYDIATSHLRDCNECQVKHDFGCLGKCLALGISDSDYYDMKYAAICAYNKEFGKQSNRLHDAIKHTKGFRHRYDIFVYGKKMPIGFEEYCMEGGK
ncbi:MAG: radical SAM protein [Peptostreptococcaceae bacterium]